MYSSMVSKRWNYYRSRDKVYYVFIVKFKKGDRNGKRM